MTLTTGSRRHRSPDRVDRSGLTLIELILVMALLAVVFAIAAPSLSRFFRGRSLDLEARRFLALTRYGQSRAVYEGVPMALWIDARQGTYGLQADSSYLEDDTNAVRFTLSDNVQIEVGTVPAGQPQEPWKRISPVSGNVPVIRFLPDGSVSVASPEYVMLRQPDDATLWIGQNRNRLNYEIQTNPPPNRPR